MEPQMMIFKAELETAINAIGTTATGRKNAIEAHRAFCAYEQQPTRKMYCKFWKKFRKVES